MDVETVNNVICQFTYREGTALEAPLYLPQNAGPQLLQQIVNELLNNEEKLPYSFYISDQELLVPLETYLQKNKGHAEAVFSVPFSPDGRHLASGSGDATRKNWVLCIAWSPDGKRLVSGSKAGDLQCWDSDRKAIRQCTCGVKRATKNGLPASLGNRPLECPLSSFVSASGDGDARIWDVSLRKCVICLTGHTRAITCVKWGGVGVIYTGMFCFKLLNSRMGIHCDEGRCHLLNFSFTFIIPLQMPKYHQCQNPPSSSHLHNFTGGKDDRDALAYAGCVLSIPSKAHRDKIPA
ncbi:hypothetical protein GH714_001840 [Hevea brasiliensis]|uniref:NLE domain-containing protein n=1 Tax=Hevea brasiliensis TaxID=3981 RepID=A0A6A6KZR7_HEVBR|nr:hypothetical protein GH714_001840 [Hevea brasiliensis]